MRCTMRRADIFTVGPVTAAYQNAPSKPGALGTVWSADGRERGDEFRVQGLGFRV